MKLALSLILALMAQMACAQEIDPSISPSLARPLGPNDPFGTEIYTLVSVKGQQASYPAQITFEAGRVAGEGPCNMFFADLTYSDDAFEIGPIGATRKACPDLAAEAEFFKLLGQVTHADRREGQITLMRGSDALLYFVAPLD
jgi:heat shock protein HslJ